MAAGAGNAAEWFDWAVYATFASFLAGALFSKADPASAFLQTLAIFAVGFVARPVGGWLFGLAGDRIGRKRAMLASVLLSAAGSLLIGVIPDYSVIGAWASLLLVVGRICQGLAHGGELPTAQTYLAEISPREERGAYASVIYVSGTLGIVGGSLVGAVLASLLSHEQMAHWGWRIPFLLGAVLGLVTLLLRSRMDESELFEDVKEEGVEAPSTWQTVRENWRSGLTVIGLTVGITVAYYVWSVSAPAYAINVLGVDEKGALWAGVAANLFMVAVLPLWGRLSDRIGRRPVLLIGALGTALVFFPATAMIRGTALSLGLAMALALLFVSAFAAISPAVYAELLPTKSRTLGVAIPYALCVALFGGTAAYLQAGMKQWFGAHGGDAFNGYAVVLLLVSAVVVLRIPETRGKDLREDD